MKPLRTYTSSNSCAYRRIAVQVAGCLIMAWFVLLAGCGKLQTDQMPRWADAELTGSKLDVVKAIQSGAYAKSWRRGGTGKAWSDQGKTNVWASDNFWTTAAGIDGISAATILGSTNRTLIEGMIAVPRLDDDQASIVRLELVPYSAGSETYTTY